LAFRNIGGGRILAQFFQRLAIEQRARLVALHLDRLKLGLARNAADEGWRTHLRLGSRRKPGTEQNQAAPKP